VRKRVEKRDQTEDEEVEAEADLANWKEFGQHGKGRSSHSRFGIDQHKCFSSAASCRKIEPWA
jgi:hypothetical protein